MDLCAYWIFLQWYWENRYLNTDELLHDCMLSCAALDYTWGWSVRFSPGLFKNV